MNINGQHYTTIWLKQGDETIVQSIDQRSLPHRFSIEYLKTVDDVARAIKEMHVRGAPLIGVTAAYGMYLAALHAPNDSFRAYMNKAAQKLIATRPTAINLSRAVQRQQKVILNCYSQKEMVRRTCKTAGQMAQEEIEACRCIGFHGLHLIQEISMAIKNKKSMKRKTVNILTHCNAGWLACIDYGTATAPIYAAFDKGISLHVWVDETRPRNQGARLTAWELGQHGVPHTVITDTMAGHLMQRGMVDMVIVGTDRTTSQGDVINKIGTYMLAVAAQDNTVPFYVALPSSSLDWTTEDAGKEILIEQRSENEVKYIEGLCEGTIKQVLVPPVQSRAVNYAFDITPARLITALITERGICSPNKKSLIELYPEQGVETKARTKTDEKNG